MSVMHAETLLLQRQDAVATITVNRPEARNALTSDMRAEMLEMCRGLANDRDVRVLVLRGAGGRTFISGADIKEFAARPGVEDLLEMARCDEQLYEAVESLPVPTIAVIEGHALGGGLVLAAVCDVRVCTSDSRFGVPSAKSLGNCLSPGQYARLVDLIGPARTKELLICAKVLSAPEAAGWGLVNDVVERDELDAHVAALTERLSRHAPLTMWAAKEAVRRLTRGHDDREDIMERVLGSEDFREGLAAFVEKRAPRWRNR